MKTRFAAREKITLQVLVVVGLVLLAAYASLAVSSAYWFGRWRNLGGPDDNLYAYAASMTLEFEEHIRWEGGEIAVEPGELEALAARNIWLQVLDENGNEVYAYHKPPAAPSHYTPADLILAYRYSGAIKDEQRGYTLFVARAERGERSFSYILGFPDSEVVKAVMVANPRTLIWDVVRMIGGTLLGVTLVVLGVGYFFGARLANPLAGIIDGIQRLAGGDYTQRFTQEGVYEEVFHSLEGLSRTLAAAETGRQQLEAAREEWIANITHDIKTPLSSLKGYAELLNDPDYTFSAEEVRQYSGIMAGKAAYMEELLADLHLTYRLKSASLPLDKKPANLVELLRESIIGVLNDPRFMDADLQFEPQVEEMAFTCDARLMQRAVTNLLVNALVHNPAGTRVEVKIWQEGRIYITIRDYGEGIPEAEVGRLFERYYRGTNTGAAHQGSGLGLAIARQVIEVHGGEIGIESCPGEGTTLRVAFGI